MGAAFLGMEAGIVRDEHEQSAAYLQGWLDTLRVQEHRRWIVHAANHAGRAANFVLGRSQSELPSPLPHEEPAGQPVLPTVA